MAVAALATPTCWPTKLTTVGTLLAGSVGAAAGLPAVGVAPLVEASEIVGWLAGLLGLLGSVVAVALPCAVLL